MSHNINNKIGVAIIGLGQRGKALLESILLEMNDITVTAVCDEYEDRTEEAAKLVYEKYNKRPLATSDYHEVLKSSDVDAVIIASAWESHISIAIEAMKAKKQVGLEVGGAYSLKQCWDLVEAAEDTGMSCMLLENCCYGRKELMVLNMVRQNLFGDIVHCSGGYHHDLREEIAFGLENRHYRLRNYLSRNCENYPTHELGPIATILNINRGNRMVSLTSTSSKAMGLNEYIAYKKPEDKNLIFNQGDIVTTVIKCANGETIVLTLDTTLPRYYSRGFTVRGTKGMYEECTDSVFIDQIHDEDHFNWKKNWNNAEEYLKKYEHPIWQKYLEIGVRGGHDGMDWLVLSSFFDSLKNNYPTPIDVYDTASWMSISLLSEESIAKGSMPVYIPDFTNGKWFNRKDDKKGFYSL